MSWARWWTGQAPVLSSFGKQVELELLVPLLVCRGSCSRRTELEHVDNERAKLKQIKTLLVCNPDEYLATTYLCLWGDR